MTRLSRLTSILLQLQSKRVVTSQELAEKFGISQRTIYRDIRALEEAGVPIIGEAGNGYSLLDEYRLPPLMFTEQELNAILTAQKYLEGNCDRSISEQFGIAVSKVQAMLRNSAKAKTELLNERVRIYPGSTEKNKTDYLALIQTAITNLNVLCIHYKAENKDTAEYRDVEPLAVYYSKNWILIANCRLRKAIREFRLDRISSLTETGKHFDETEFSFEKYIATFSEGN